MEDKEIEQLEETQEPEVSPQKRDYEEELLSIIRSDLSSSEIREKLTDYHDNDIASVFGELSEVERKKLYRILSDDEISDIFSYLENVEDYITEIDAEKGVNRLLMWVWYSGEDFSTPGFIGFRRRFRSSGNYYTYQISIPADQDIEKSRKELQQFIQFLKLVRGNE